MAQSPETGTGSVPTPPNARNAVSAVVSLALFAAILFVPAGRLDWIAGWVYVAIMVATIAVNYVYLRRVNPELIAYRSRIGKGTKIWDLIWAGGFAPVFLAIYVVAALDAGRFGWSSMSYVWWPVGLALFLPGTVVFIWSMGVNPFFEKTVRIQSERGHRVIDTGPYRIVRHPGYAGFLGWIVSAPPMLGSWWAFVPAALSVVALAIRTALEDRTLRDELKGYDAYTGRVRYRLVPGL